MAFRPTRVALKYNERNQKLFGQISTKVYTVTGGSGEVSTEPAKSLEELKSRNLALYHRCIRLIPFIKEQYNVVDAPEKILGAMRDQFDRYRDVTDLKIANVLHMKGKLDLEEIERQFKQAHHILGKIEEYEERKLREKHLASLESGVDSSISSLRSALHNAQLETWRKSGVIPRHVADWSQFQKWKSEQEVKFEAFANDLGLFSSEDLAENKKLAKQSGCSIM